MFRRTSYPCDPYDLAQCASISNDFPHSARTPDSATTDLERFLDPYTWINSTVQAAIDRLVAGLYIPDWTPDLVIKAFYDLDTVFFDGKLRGMTTILWRRKEWWIEQSGSRDGYRRQLAKTNYLGHQKAAIELNAWGILLDTPDAKMSMWSVVLHEMVVSPSTPSLPRSRTALIFSLSPTIQHAYEHVMCGSSPPTPYDLSRGWDDGHGLMFRRLIHPVHERAMSLLRMPVIHMNYTRDCKVENYEI